MIGMIPHCKCKECEGMFESTHSAIEFAAAGDSLNVCPSCSKLIYLQSLKGFSIEQRLEKIEEMLYDINNTPHFHEPMIF